MRSLLVASCFPNRTQLGVGPDLTTGVIKGGDTRAERDDNINRRWEGLAPRLQILPQCLAREAQPAQFTVLSESTSVALSHWLTVLSYHSPRT